MIVPTMANAQSARPAGLETVPVEGAASAPAPGETGPTFGKILAGAGGPRASAKESGDHAHAAPARDERDERRHGDDQTPANGGAAIQSAVPIAAATVPAVALAAFGHEGYLARPAGENASGPIGAGLGAGSGPAEGTPAAVSTHNDFDPGAGASSVRRPADSAAAAATSMAPGPTALDHPAAAGQDDAGLVMAGIHASAGNLSAGVLAPAADQMAVGGPTTQAGIAERGSRPSEPLTAGTSIPNAMGVSTGGGMPALTPAGAAGKVASLADAAAVQEPPMPHAPGSETGMGRLDTVLVAGKVADGQAPPAARTPRLAGSRAALPASDTAMGSTPVGAAPVTAPAHAAAPQAGLAAGPLAHATNGHSLPLPADAVAVAVAVAVAAPVPAAVVAGAASPRQAQYGSGIETKGKTPEPAPSPLHPGHSAAAQPLGSFALAAEQGATAGQSVAQAHVGTGKALDLHAVLSPIVEGVVVRHASLRVGEAVSSFRVVLEPKSLGQVVVNVATGSHGLQVLLTPQHADTGTLLHAHLTELVSSLRAGDVGPVQVSVAPRSESPDTGQTGGAGMAMSMGFQNQGGQGFYSGGQNPTPWARPENGSNWSAPAAVPTPVTADGPRSFTRAGASRVDVQI